MRIIRAVRVSIEDVRRCPHCAEYDNTTFELPAQAAEWEAMPLPDPECAGGDERCRCGWLIVWGRQLAAGPDVAPELEAA